MNKAFAESTNSRSVISSSSFTLFSSSFNMASRAAIAAIRGESIVLRKEMRAKTGLHNFSSKLFAQKSYSFTFLASSIETPRGTMTRFFKSFKTAS